MNKNIFDEIMFQNEELVNSLNGLMTYGVGSDEIESNEIYFEDLLSEMLENIKNLINS